MKDPSFMQAFPTNSPSRQAAMLAVGLLLGRAGVPGIAKTSTGDGLYLDLRDWSPPIFIRAVEVLTSIYSLMIVDGDDAVRASVVALSTRLESVVAEFAGALLESAGQSAEIGDSLIARARSAVDDDSLH